MKKNNALILLLLLFSSALYAQKENIEAVFAFPISDYIIKNGDSIVIVQVQVPDGAPFDIKEKQVGLLKHRYENGKTLDTASIGWGRCHLIKGDYRYFGIHVNAGQKVSPGDLMYLKLSLPLAYKGYMFALSRHHIHLQMVDDSYAYRREDVYGFTNAGDENKLLDTLVADIRYTGKVMKEQMPDNNQDIKSGIFKGQKLFDAMQAAKREHLITFLRYMEARPQKYAGLSWKVSEIFATWMVSDTPTVVE
jgi:hypothetical protein